MATTLRFFALVIFICMGLGYTAKAQQITMFSNFYDNQFFYNPAVAGATYFGELRGVFHQQWQGLEDAPMSQYLGYQQGSKDKPFGLGIIGFNDRAGQLTNMGAIGAIAYHLKAGDDFQFSLGFAGGISRWTIDQERARLTNSFDNTVMEANSASATPMLNLGLQLRYKGMYLSLSSPQILETEANFSDDQSAMVNDLKRHFFATTGFYISLGDRIGIEPQGHFRYFETVPAQLNLGLRLHFSQVWLGAYHTLNESISMQGGFELGHTLAVYYAYDGTSNGLRNAQTGSHEIGLAYLIGKNKDSDGDQILDHKDDCPEEPGPAENNGCPKNDGDEDGIPDDKDKCPDVPGLSKYAGCPDTDGDGLIDEIDQCPKKAGKPENMGCPDTDGDGTVDQKDECPEIPGLAEHRGCPDTDGDGISNKLDNCPNELGPIENSGCPWSDSDGDGILDNVDRCPTLPGLETNGGCPPQAIPDTDGDGLTDDVDECAGVAGPVSNNGCPQLSASSRDTIFLALVNLEFVSGKSTIKPQSFPYLDELAELMISKQNWRLSIVDDSGGEAQRDEYYERLSRERAVATRDYLVSQGVPNSQFFFQFFDEKQSVITYQDSDGDSVPDNIDKCPRTAGPKSNNGCPEISESQEEIIFLALVNLEFEFDKSIIKPRSFPYLDQLAELMVAKRDWKLRIAGHTDDVGSDEYNMRLSRDRALATRNYLMSRGMSNTQFVIQYFGETQPIDSNETEMGRQRNRRVELEFIFD